MLEERNLLHMKEELKQIYSIMLKLLLQPLCGVTVTTSKMQLLSSKLSFLHSIAVTRRTTATPQQRAQTVV
jgi:hypothetical protein